MHKFCNNQRSNNNGKSTKNSNIIGAGRNPWSFCIRCRTMSIEKRTNVLYNKRVEIIVFIKQINKLKKITQTCGAFSCLGERKEIEIMQKGFKEVNLHGCVNGVLAVPVIGENGNWYIGNEDTGVNAGGGGTGGDKSNYIKELWTNQNDTVDFLPQTIEISEPIENFRYYEIIYRNTIPGEYHLSTGLIPSGSRAILSTVNGYIRYRCVLSAVGNAIEFSKGYFVATYGSTSVLNNLCVPYKVIGIK